MLKRLFNLFNDQHIGRQPVYLAQILKREPSGRFVFQKCQMPFFHAAPVAGHRQMEFRIIIFNRCKIIIHGNVGRKLFPDFAGQSLLRGFPGFDFSAGKFPPVLITAISSLCCEDLVTFSGEFIKA